MWQVDAGREVWKAEAPLLTPPDKEGVTLINQLTLSSALDSVIMTTYDHSIIFSKTSTMDVWKQVLLFYHKCWIDFPVLYYKTFRFFFPWMLNSFST